jgi:AraC-like DNA-binding protein
MLALPWAYPDRRHNFLRGAAVLNNLYGFLRGASGFSLAVIGLSFYFEPTRDRARRSFGSLFLAAGSLFSLSALDPILRIQTDLSNLITIGLILCLSQSLLDIALYFLGDEAPPSLRRKAWAAGLGWSALLCIAPFLDYAFGWAGASVSIEDARPMGPTHKAVSIAMYLWPIAVCLLTIRFGRRSGLGRPGSRAVRALSLFAAAAAAILALVLAALISGSSTLYRMVHTCLELFLIVWFYALTAKPKAFALIREELRKEREQNLLLDDGEAARIGRRLEAVVGEGRIILKPDLDLGSLAARLEIPAYRLSHYLNVRLGSSFPAWINARRVELVCERLKKEGDRSILEIAMDAGFGSKAVFNEQFRKIMGMSPSEYRSAMGISSRRKPRRPGHE